MKWLHLSDLHFNYKNYDSETLKTTLINKLKEFSDIEFIVITGDCVYQFDNNKKNIDSLVNYIESIRKICNVKRRDLYVTPGNHDINRDDSKRKEIIQDILSKKDTDINDDDFENLKSRGYSSFELIHKRLTGRYYDFQKVIEREGYNIINIDTCLTYLGSDSDNKLLCCLKPLKLKNNDNINIAIMHHGISFFKNSYSKRFQNWAEENNIDIVLCGHSHRAGIKTFDDLSSGLKQFTCGAALVDDYAIPSFIIYDYNPKKSTIDVNMYAYSKDIGQWTIASNHSRAFNNGVFKYSIPRKNKFIASDIYNNTDIELLSFNELNIINNLNEKFKSVYGNEFYSSKTGAKEKFDSETAIYSIVQMDVPYIYALQIVNNAINTICTNEYRNTLINQEIWSSDFRKVIYQTICDLSPGQQYTKEDLNTIASKYARRYGHDSRMRILKDEKTIELDNKYIENLYNEIVTKTTGIERYDLPSSEKSQIEKFLMSFLQHLDIHEINNTSVVNFLTVIVTSPPHPWLLAKGKEKEIRKYHTEKVTFHIPALKESFKELTVVETIYHSAALFISYYSRIFGISEKYPLTVLENTLNEVLNNNYSTNFPVSIINKVELKKDLNNLNIDIKQLYECVNFLQLILNKPITKIGDKEKIITNIEQFKEITFLISDYISNKKHKIINSNEIIQSTSQNNFNTITAFFSSIQGVFVKHTLQQHENAFWISPHFNTNEINYNQILIAIFYEESIHKILEYLEKKLQKQELNQSAMILIKPDLDVFNNSEVVKISVLFDNIIPLFYMNKSTINRINYSSNKREAFKKFLEESEEFKY